MTQEVFFADQGELRSMEVDWKEAWGYSGAFDGLDLTRVEVVAAARYGRNKASRELLEKLKRDHPNAVILFEWESPSYMEGFGSVMVRPPDFEPAGRVRFVPSTAQVEERAEEYWIAKAIQCALQISARLGPDFQVRGEAWGVIIEMAGLGHLDAEVIGTSFLDDDVVIERGITRARERFGRYRRFVTSVHRTLVEAGVVRASDQPTLLWGDKTYPSREPGRGLELRFESGAAVKIAPVGGIYQVTLHKEARGVWTNILLPLVDPVRVEEMVP